MKPIPKKLREKISKNPFMGQCIHKAHNGCNECEGHITWEHAYCYAGSQINEEWNIVPCCVKHNVGVSGEEKEFNRFVALERAPMAELKTRYPKFDWIAEYEKLRQKFKHLPNFLFSKDTLLK